MTEMLKVVGGDGLTTEDNRKPEEIYCESLVYRMFLTRGARYQAARRHQKRSNASIWSIIFLSMYVFSTNVFLALNSFALNQSFQLFLIILNIVMSAFIIAFSVLEHGKKHDLKAELFLRCAQGIGDLHDNLKFELDTGSINKAKVQRAVQQYTSLVNDFSDNHSETDYRTFRSNIGKHKGQPFYRAWQNWKYLTACWSLMWVSIFLPPITIIAAMSIWLAPSAP